MIMCKEKFASAIDKAVFPGVQGGPHEHIIAAKAVAYGEALKPEFQEYSKQVIKNAQALAKAFAGERISGGFRRHGQSSHARSIFLEAKISPAKKRKKFWSGWEYPSTKT